MTKETVTQEQALPGPLAEAFVKVLEVMQPLDVEGRRHVLRALEVVMADAEAELEQHLRPQRHRKGNPK